MRKLDLILENIRDEYMINLLEEGEVSELETLKTKKFLNENLNRIRGMLVEEGALDSVKNHLANNWGKYLAGAGVGLGAYGLANTDFGNEVARSFDSASKELPYDSVGNVAGRLATNLGNDISGGVEDAKEAVTGAYNDAKEGVQNFIGQVTDQSPISNAEAVYGASAGNDAIAQAAADGTLTPEQLRDPEVIAAIEQMNAGADAAKARLAAQGIAGAAGAAGLGAAGYGAKKAYDKYKK